MARILIKYEACYADEFEVYGFYITTQKKWDKHLEEIEIFFKDRTRPIEVYFGTNEYIEYYNFEEYKSHFTIITITREEKDVLTKLFTPYKGKVQFGIVCDIDPEDYEE